MIGEEYKFPNTDCLSDNLVIRETGLLAKTLIKNGFPIIWSDFLGGVGYISDSNEFSLYSFKHHIEVGVNINSLDDPDE